MTLPEIPAIEAPLTFEAPPPDAPGMPNPMPPALPWGEPITASKAIDLLDASGNPEPALPTTAP